MAITTITKEMVSVNAIQGTLIADNAITAVHIATNAVSGTLIADNAVTATHIAQNTITVTQLADDCVESAKIADGIITTNHLNKAMISSQTEVAVATGDFVLIGDTSDSNNLKKAPISSILAGTLTTAAQTNITSLGTLTSLTLAGDITKGSGEFKIKNTADGQNVGIYTTSSSSEVHALKIHSGGNVEIKSGALVAPGGATISKAGNGNAAILHVTDTADTEVAWFEGNRAGDTGAFISVYHNPSTPQETNRSGIRFQGDDDGGNKTNYAKITQYIEDNTNTTEDARLGINVMSDGSDNEVVNIRKDQFIYKGDAGGSYIRVDNRGDGYDTGFEIYQNGGRKWEIHSDDSNSDALDFRPAGVQKFTMTQDGKFGIGTTSPSATLHILTSTNSPCLIESRHGSGGYIELQVSDNTSAGELTGFIGDSEALIAGGQAGDLAIRAQEDFVISTGGSTQRFQINSSGSAIFSQNDSTVTIGDAGTNAATIKASANDELYVGGDDNDGYFRIKDDGNTQVKSPSNFWVNIDGGDRYGFDSAQLYPATDNYYSLGHSSYRWHTVYRVNESSSSDERKKTTLTALTDNEIKASKLLAKEIGTYKWLKDVSEKGDKAKINVGLTAQKVVEIMNSCSLNALDYQMVQYYEWDAEEALEGTRLTTDENGNSKIETYEEKPAREAGNEYAVSYEQINQFIAAGFNARLEAGGL